MEIELDEIAQLPISLKIKWQDGKTESLLLPRLTLLDYAPWIAEETTRLKAVSIKTIPPNMNPVDRARALQIAERQTATFDDIAKMVLTPLGADKVNKLSMNKAGIEADKQSRVLAILPAGKGSELAVALSTLFTAAPVAVENNANPPQGGEADGNPAPGSEPTGSKE